MRLVLVRHGQTDSNVSGSLDTGLPGADLNDAGRTQAQDLCAQWDTLIGGEIDLIAASTVVRTQQTAAPLAQKLGLPVAVFEGIREIQAGSYEMRNDEEAVRAYITALYHWLQGDLDHCLGGKETGRGVLERFDAVIAELSQRVGEGTAVIFAHGAIIRFWAASRVAGVEPALVAQFPLPNTATSISVGNPEQGFTAVTWCDKPIDSWDIPEVMDMRPSAIHGPLR